MKNAAPLIEASTERPASVGELLKRYEAASDAVVRAARARFKRGTLVHWQAAGYQQTGEVAEVMGFEARNLRLRVMNRVTGKLVDLYLYRIQEATK